MASTYSPNLRIELIGTGEQANTWGTTTNTNLGTLIEQAISGAIAVNVTAGNVTLTALDGATDQSRQMIIEATGTPGVARTITAPAVDKVYIVDNTSDSDLYFIAAGGAGTLILPGTTKYVYCDGTNFFDAINAVDTLTFPDGTVQSTALTSNYLQNSDIGVTVEGYDATILKSAAIGVTVEGYDATILKSAAIGVAVQAYDVDTTKNDVANTFTATQTLPAIKLTTGAGAAKVLTSDASGNATWTTAAAGGATSINGLTDGYNVGGSVGLGTGALANDDGTANNNTAVGTSALTANTTGSYNSAVGMNALLSNTTGVNNSAAGYAALLSNTTGTYNSAMGMNALLSNTTGSYNSAMGPTALYYNTTGTSNSAMGVGALLSNTTGTSNSAIGRSALHYNTTGSANSAVGEGALYNNTTGTYNSAVGQQALYYNTTGVNNSAIGRSALNDNTTGSYNSAMGQQALSDNTTGNSNSAVGMGALSYNTTGSYNSAMGQQALFSNTTGNYNIGVGYNAGSTTATVNGECTLGDANITNLRCNDTTISSLSDRRDKAEITDAESSAGLELIMKLRPVTYYWDRREWYADGVSDGTKLQRTHDNKVANSGQRLGFIAQEVLEAVSGIKSLEDSQIVTTENPDKLEFAPAHLITPLVKAIQEQQALIEALTLRLTNAGL